MKGSVLHIVILTISFGLFCRSDASPISSSTVKRGLLDVKENSAVLPGWKDWLREGYLDTKLFSLHVAEEVGGFRGIAD